MKNHLLPSALLLALASSASAFPIYFQQFQEHYQTNEIDVSQLAAEESCGLCHVSAGGGGRRNAYGQDFLQAVRQGEGFSGAEFFDSDEDGFDNLEEIWFNSAPGNSAKTPQGRIEILRNEGTFQISTGTACAKLEVLGLNIELEGGTRQSFDNISEVVIPASTTGGILARCLTEGIVGSAFGQ